MEIQSEALQSAVLQSIKKIPFQNDWWPLLAEEFNKEYMQQLREFLRLERQKGFVFFPPGDQIFSAFKLTPFSKTKVVILGQDPYHGPGQAHGLSFSVQTSVKPPPSLLNIYKELKSDLGVLPVSHGFLKSWADQGVLLLNACLTVRANQANSHRQKGWEEFTGQVLRILNESKQNLVFILWGADAQKRGQEIDRKKHLVIESVHPSPLSAHRGFFGSKPFSRANCYLEANGIEPVSWQLPDLAELTTQSEAT